MRRLLVGLVVAGVTGCGEADALAVVSQNDVFVEPDTGAYISDFDVLSAGPPSSEGLRGVVQEGLTVAQKNGHDDVWPREHRHSLTYCIDVGAFGSAAASVNQAMAAASADWSRTAGVTFVHAAAEDARCTRSNSKVVFDVRPVAHRPYLARSFFPSSTRAMRELLIDATALPPPAPYSLTGVVRHELGHVLGLRHEHTRLADNPCFEDNDWRAVTPYDRASVMHYPQCAGLRGHDLVLTELDRRGVAALYH